MVICDAVSHTDIMPKQGCKRHENNINNGESSQHKAKRQQLPLNVRMEMVRLKDAGKRTNDIYDHFQGSYAVSTICTQFSASGRARIQKDIKNRCPPNATRTSHLRPHILIDMEVVLYELIMRSEHLHLSLTKESVCTQAKNIIDFLNESGDYDSEGKRCTDGNVVPGDVIRGMPINSEPSLSSPPDQPIDKECFPCDPSNLFQSEPALSHDEPVPSHTKSASSEKSDYLFKASNGWLDNFKGRYQISSKMLKGEQGTANEKSAESFVKEFTTKLSTRYRPQEALRITIIINETGVQYKSVPSRYYVRSGITIKAKKPGRARLTVLLAAAGDGHKFKLLVIGKAKRPMALMSEDMSKLPVSYAYNPSAWLTEEIMIDWFTRHLIPEIKKVYGDTKVIVTLDNCSAHPVTLKSLDSNIEVEFFLSNTTSLIQPMDQCAIMSFKSILKRIYYKKMVEYSLDNLDCPDPYTSFLAIYTIKDAISDFADAWHNVSVNTVKKSFNKIIDKNMLVRLYNNRVSTKDEYALFSDVEDNPHSDEDSATRTSQNITGRLNQCAEERQDGTCYSQAAITDDIIYSPGVQDRDIANLVDEVLRRQEGDLCEVSDMQDQEDTVIQQNITSSLQKLSDLDYLHDALGLTTLAKKKYLEHLKGIREILNTSVCRNYLVMPQGREPSSLSAKDTQLPQTFTSSEIDTQMEPEEVSIPYEDTKDEGEIYPHNESKAFIHGDTPMGEIHSWFKREYNEDNTFESEDVKMML